MSIRTRITFRYIEEKQITIELHAEKNKNRRALMSLCMCSLVLRWSDVLLAVCFLFPPSWPLTCPSRLRRALYVSFFVPWLCVCLCSRCVLCLNYTGEIYFCGMNSKENFFRRGCIHTVQRALVQRKWMYPTILFRNCTKPSKWSR